MLLKIHEILKYGLRCGIYGFFFLSISFPHSQVVNFFKWKHHYLSKNIAIFHPIPLFEQKKVSFDDFFMMTWKQESEKKMNHKFRTRIIPWTLEFLENSFEYLGFLVEHKTSQQGAGSKLFKNWISWNIFQDYWCTWIKCIFLGQCSRFLVVTMTWTLIFRFWEPWEKSASFILVLFNRVVTDSYFFL